ncbi:2-oxo-4-hydroxy-4-carboxy-5-ureidoimidazolinedecarboxylase [Wickerhamomyces ciferrii]|uniref:2-oxo-4-hydroxy-4-carboxy-5-ureidoimidazolinedecarboxylase n=1 Tax=Wickerhamomyces ciferrii (strain ATCC 14091 / BCRC 22168 / CBS 111 / JCM 3599 / NBRC 0793 / NRRL Y-1031 F-60-10) TaxID=1206466 RepID=K0KES4_WICCF|nr:2-oxo-4-hydroxy-4-carboxy-5-ureidoimidazolinedecarboxylase [Wickerhamomyces ciferrii]CCH41436.1 2-oxo-4-hydroxy-4-carboxy-5-ureidoimidazolinedecarboxylase [Wickerhamomyces ciferrii]
MYQLPDIATLPGLPQQEQDQVLIHLFEESNTLIQYLRPYLSTPFTSYLDFIQTSRDAFLKLVNDRDLKEIQTDYRVHDIISCHPRLGVPKTVKLSEHSSKEQASLQSNDEIISKFIKLNEDYESQYPGLKFVLFVNGRSKDQVIELFNSRIERNDYKQEVIDALNAMCDIAIDRYKKLSAKI